jgi:hypothetical protein
MGQVWTDFPLGNTQNLSQISWNYAPEEIVEPYALTEKRFLKNTILTVTTEDEICAIGIEAPDAGGLGAADVTSVSATYAEVTTPLNYLPRFPGEDLETGVRQMYLGTDCLIFLSTRKSYTIAGQGVCPVTPETAINDFLSNYVTKDFLPAYDNTGTFSIPIDALAQITPIDKTTPKDDKWTWNIAAECLVENPSPSSDNLLTPDGDVSALIPSGMKGIYSNTLTMNKGSDSKATDAWTLQLHYTS